MENYIILKLLNYVPITDTIQYIFNLFESDIDELSKLLNYMDSCFDEFTIPNEYSPNQSSRFDQLLLDKELEVIDKILSNIHYIYPETYVIGVNMKIKNIDRKNKLFYKVTFEDDTTISIITSLCQLQFTLSNGKIIKFNKEEYNDRVYIRM